MSANIITKYSNGCKVIRDKTNEIFVDLMSSASINLPIGVIGNFIDDICDDIIQRNKEGNIVYYAEDIKLKSDISLYLNFNFKYNGETINEAHLSNSNYFITMRFLFRIIYVIQKVLRDKYDVSSEDLVCAYGLSSPMKVENDYHIKLTLRFPFIRASRDNFNNILIPLIRETLVERGVMKRIEKSSSKPVNKWGEIVRPIDEAIPMFGCADKDRLVDTFKFCIRALDAEESLEDSEYILENFDDYSVDISDEIFNPYHHQYISKYNISKLIYEDDCLVDKDEDSESSEIDDYSTSIDHALFNRYYTPFIFTTSFKSSVTPLRDNTGIESMEIDVKDFTIKGMTNTFLKMLSNSRFTDLNEILTIGNCFRNIKLNIDKANFRKRKDKFENIDPFKMFKEKFGNVLTTEYQLDVYEVYESLNNNFVDHETLAYFAREDSPEAFETWTMSWLEDVLDSPDITTQMSCAELLYRLCWLDNKYCTINNKWFFFDGTRWTDDGKKTLSLQEEVRDSIIPFLNEMRQNCINLSNNTRNDVENRNNETLLSRVSNVLKQFNTGSSQGAIFKLATSRFMHRTFSAIIDTNPLLLGTESLVLEVVDLEHKVIVRSGKPQDYITYSTNYHWNPIMNENHPHYLKIVKIFKSLFPDPDMFDFGCRTFAGFLRGGNKDKLFHNMIGKANGGKSGYKKMLEKMFGMYASNLPPETITVTRMASNSGLSPATASAVKGRVAIVSETDVKDTLHCGKIKAETGRDSKYARKCNENGGDMIPLYSLIHLSNVIAHIPNADTGLYVRIIITLFESEFTANAPKDEAEQIRLKKFPIDKNFDKTIDNLGPALLFFAVKWYTSYSINSENNLLMPSRIHEHIQRFKMKNDEYLRFIDTFIEKVWIDEKEGQRDNDKFVTLEQLHTRFANWYKDKYSGDTPANINTFEESMSQEFRMGDIDEIGRRWYGWQFKNRD